MNNLTFNITDILYPTKQAVNYTQVKMEFEACYMASQVGLKNGAYFEYLLHFMLILSMIIFIGVGIIELKRKLPLMMILFHAFNYFMVVASVIAYSIYFDQHDYIYWVISFFQIIVVYFAYMNMRRNL